MVGNKDSILDINIINNSNYIDYCKTLYDDSWKISIKIAYITYMVDFLISNVTVYFSDDFIEEKLNDISQSLAFNLSESFTKNSVLHVVTESYSTGGHTKLLEMFIENTSSYFKKQSIVLLNQKVDLPSTLKSIANKTGEIFILEEDNIINKAIKLANLASSYEFIVLHIHQNEIITNLAFGNKNFKRPVFFLNHADHMFWCGVSISDYVLDLSTEGSEFSKTQRGVNKSYVLPIPIKDEKKNISKNDARNYLHLDKKSKIILSIASEYKYGRKKEDISKFINMSMNILNNVENSIFILIGPSKNNIIWNEAYEKSNHKIIPLGLQERELLSYYIASCDLYIESYPFSSYTAFLDVALYNVNMLSLNTPIFTLDVLKENNILTNTVKEIEKRAIDLLIQNDLKSSIDLSNHFQEKWLKNLKNIFDYNTKIHNLYSFKPKSSNVDYNNHINKIIMGMVTLNKTYTKLPFLLKYKLRKGIIKYEIISGIKNNIRLFRKTFISR
ncbi:MAG: hypothetical protein RBR59_07080 [Sulfurimonadaceae bacterium]|jgi:hypothetical protein|nr:hypothetical protein [Sulfurimonadaceae bacterium]